jgi:two-component system NtrC family sensor kinase
MGNNGVLSLSLKNAVQEDQSGVYLTIRDSGPGIESDRTSKVFDPFFTTKLGDGTGLGLSISQTIIQRAGGLISVRNHPSGGAEFRVWLPSVSEAKFHPETAAAHSI